MEIELKMLMMRQVDLISSRVESGRNWFVLMTQLNESRWEMQSCVQLKTQGNVSMCKLLNSIRLEQKPASVWLHAGNLHSETWKRLRRRNMKRTSERISTVFARTGCEEGAIRRMMIMRKATYLVHRTKHSSLSSSVGFLLRDIHQIVQTWSSEGNILYGLFTKDLLL